MDLGFVIDVLLVMLNFFLIIIIGCLLGTIRNQLPLLGEECTSNRYHESQTADNIVCACACAWRVHVRL